jgi:hypothetical protein
MTSREGRARVLSDAQIQQFIDDGFVRIDEAFPSQLADACRAILWRDLPCDPDEPKTWTRPVVRLGWYDDPPFREAANTPVLHAAFDQLVGRGRWRPRTNLGGFPVRFPSDEDPGDAGWHIDTSFPGQHGNPEERHDFSDWRANVTSHGRALLMLFLFSDVGESDAPTRIKAGSHLDIARVLAPAGEAGMSNPMLAPHLAEIDQPVVRAAAPAPSISAIPSSCMPRNCTTVRRRASSRNRRCIRQCHCRSTAPTATIRQWSSRSGRRYGQSPNRQQKRRRRMRRLFNLACGGLTPLRPLPSPAPGRNPGPWRRRRGRRTRSRPSRRCRHSGSRP